MSFIGLVRQPLRIVMEYVRGRSLSSFLRKKLRESALTAKDPQWGLRLRLALDIARGVDAMHSNDPPIIHRDMKSSNILVRKSLFRFL